MDGHRRSRTTSSLCSNEPRKKLSGDVTTQKPFDNEFAHDGDFRLLPEGLFSLTSAYVVLVSPLQLN
jgi:hypothetical protein